MGSGKEEPALVLAPRCCAWQGWQGPLYLSHQTMWFYCLLFCPGVRGSFIYSPVYPAVALLLPLFSCSSMQPAMPCTKFSQHLAPSRQGSAMWVGIAFSLRCPSCPTFPPLFSSLVFLTGSDRIPIYGMSSLRIVIQSTASGEQYLPVAHTCYNLLDLPKYSSKEILSARLVQAIDHYEGFSLA